MRYQGIAFRGHNPRWSFAPISGEGAAVHGGRFNPKGVPALYLATTVEGAFLEATQGFARKFAPLTMCTYEVDCADIIDLTSDQLRNAAGISISDMSCAWASELADGRQPPSWKVFDQLSTQSAGILVPSFAHHATNRMTNLVLWDWAESGEYSVRVYDPEGLLPHNQDSWK